MYASRTDKSHSQGGGTHHHRAHRLEMRRQEVPFTRFSPPAPVMGSREMLPAQPMRPGKTARDKANALDYVTAPCCGDAKRTLEWVAYIPRSEYGMYLACGTCGSAEY